MNEFEQKERRLACHNSQDIKNAVGMELFKGCRSLYLDLISRVLFYQSCGIRRAMTVSILTVEK